MKNDNTRLPGSGLTVGIDVGDKYSQICVLDVAAEVIDEGRVRTTWSAMGGRLGAMARCRVVIEVGGHSPWLSRLLEELGHECIVANPRRVRLIADSAKKNDRIDAETLARLGRADPALLSPVFHRSEQAQADLAVIHSRRALVETRTGLVNRVRSLAKAYGARLPPCDARYFPERVAARAPPQLGEAIRPLLEVVATVSAQIKTLDGRLESMIAERYQQARLLEQVTGVGPVISIGYILTIGDPHRFKSSRQVGAYLGLVPRQHSSGEKTPELGISKTGNVYLRQLLVNGAHYILGSRGPDCDLRRWGLRKAEGGKNAKKRAVIAVARKLAVLLHRLWITGEVYTPLLHEEEVKAA